MANLERVVVGVSTNDELESTKMVNFLTCLVNHFSPNELSTLVDYEIKDGMLVLFAANQAKSCYNNMSTKEEEACSRIFNGVTLYHSPQCPFWKLDECIEPLTLTPKSNGIYVGVTVLVESSDSRILMTQRADHMRSFPRAWVPPGGNLEIGEQPLQGALRELREETGLLLNSSNSKTELFCLWESAFPPLIALGEPRHHHIVLYFLSKVSESWEQLQTKIVLDSNEVKACTWLTLENVKSLFSRQSDKVECVQKFFVGSDGKLQPSELNIHGMFHAALWADGKIYTGSQLALRKWMEYQEEYRNELIPSKI